MNIIYRLENGLKIFIQLRRKDDRILVKFYRPDTSETVKLPPVLIDEFDAFIGSGRSWEDASGGGFTREETRKLVEDHEEQLREAGFLSSSKTPDFEGEQVEEDASSHAAEAYLDASRRLLQEANRDGAIENAKRCISMARRRIRASKQGSKGGGGGGGGETESDYAMMIGESYLLMGDAYMAQGKQSKAQTSYMLAIKVQPKNEAARAALAIAMSGIQQQRRHEGGGGEALEASPSNCSTDDVEDFLSLHTVKQLQDPLAFSCTMCGECCRKTDNILLTPLDMFLMSRANSMGLFGVLTTSQLIQHPHFKQAFFFVLRDGYPICHLRPVKSSSGQCHFAYKLFTKPTVVSSSSSSFSSSSSSSSSSSTKDIMEERGVFPGTSPSSLLPPPPPSLSHAPSALVQEKRKLLTFEEVQTHLLEMEEEDASSAAAAHERPLLPSDYNITEEEELAALADCDKYDEDDEAEEEDEQDDEEEISADGSRVRGRNDSPRTSILPVINSFGQAALGCMLGPSNMPTICAAYPVASELSVADFWHVRRPFWLHDELKNSSSTSQHQKQQYQQQHQQQVRIDYDWEEEEQYVSIRTERDGCEGFITDQSKRRTPLNSKAEYSNDPAIDVPGHSQQTVHEFLHSTSSPSMLSVAERGREMQWFLGLLQDVTLALPISLFKPSNADTKRLYVNVLAKIWFNFDALNAAKTRQIKSYARLKREIETLTWALVHSTKEFLSASSTASVAEYEELLVRLNI